MHWFGLGPSTMEARLREVEIFFRRVSRVSHRDPDQELPEVDLPDGERDAALEREATRRWLKERG
ncbi:MAG: hypothetical protein WEE64_06645 [Dehalococcoidia bacterium]